MKRAAFGLFLRKVSAPAVYSGEARASLVGGRLVQHPAER